MENKTEIYLGFDPGGDKKFGVAIIDGSCVRASTVNTVDGAMDWAERECGSRDPVAAGIDTLIHWATGKGGLRPCDFQLQHKYPCMKKSIMAPNSLFGAMAVGGVALAIRLREKWPKLVLNETHPKVLLYCVQGKRYDPESKETVEAAIQWLVHEGSYDERSIKGEHELDAAVSAWGTHKGIVENWTDIVGSRKTLLFPAGDVRYLWPESLR